MADVQTTYNQSQPILVEGQKVNGEEYNAVSRTVESAAGILFGKPAQRGSADLGVIAATAALTAVNFVGIVVRDLTVPATSPGKNPQYDTACVLTEGVIAVKVAEAVTPGAPALYDPATGLYHVSALAGRVAIPGARFDTTTAANGLAHLSLKTRAA